MTAQRLNHVLLLHIHKDITEKLDPHCVAKEFVCRNDRRKSVFGLFFYISAPTSVALYSRTNTSRFPPPMISIHKTMTVLHVHLFVV